MNDQQARELIKKTFEQQFDKTRFINFTRELLNTIDMSKAFHAHGDVKESFRSVIRTYERIGTYTLPAGEKIDILIVYLQKAHSIHHARVTQRNFAGKYLADRGEKDAGLFAFVSPDPADWRFSLVKMDYRFKEQDGKTKVKEEFTPSRWSFLVGANEKSHTAQSKFVPILKDDENNPTMAQLEEAFNIEKVTKEFFLEYRRLFIWTKEELDKAVESNPKTQADFVTKDLDTVNLAKKMLGQIVFLYFLQKKGWFGVPKNVVWGEGSKNFLRELFEKKHRDYKNFFNDILEPLFYDALRRNRSEDDQYYPYFNCKIPFLNGGLFDPMKDYDWVHTDILIPNELFSNQIKTKEGDTGNGILDIFDRYNFTVKEDEPLEKEVAIDPELLGKAYEKFNAIRPDNFDEFIKAVKGSKKGEESKFNKQYGVYYTPREIVHYMCQQSLINYLDSEVSGVPVSGVAEAAGRPADYPTKDELAFLIQHGESLREHEAQSAEKETKTYAPIISESIRRNATRIDEKLAAIKICDPAVGSGAFPVGMMSEIVRAREILKIWTKTDKTAYDFKRECIENSLYGVDIDEGAVEIAKLRLWLSLIVDEDEIGNIKPLPNLDYKVVCGNSLLGLPDGIILEEKIQTALEIKKKEFFDITDPTLKQKNRQEINDLFSKLIEKAKQYDPSLSAINFDFHTHFSEVFHSKGGFDIIIANPPYVGNKGHKDEFQKIQQGTLGHYYERRMDLLYFFFHLALDIAKEGASISFITTNYYPTATGARKLRKDFKERATIRNLINFNELKIFESALGQHNLITILEKKRNEHALAQNCLTQRQGFATPLILQNIFNKQDKETNYFEIMQKDLYDGDEHYIRITESAGTSREPVQRILDKLKDKSEYLGMITHISTGIQTSADKVTKKHVEKFNIKANVGDGIYILRPDELKQKGISTKSEHVKPWFKNSDIQKYSTNISIEKYVLYFKDKKIKQPIENEILNHFKGYKELLLARLTVCKNNQFQWNIVSKWIDKH